MAREKPNYREMLEFLSNHYPMALSRCQVQEILGVSAPTLRKIIAKGHIKIVDGMIPLGSIASYLC